MGGQRLHEYDQAINKKTIQKRIVGSGATHFQHGYTFGNSNLMSNEERKI